MYKLKKGDLRTVIYSERDIDLYKQAGWTICEEEEKPIEKPKAQKKDIDEQGNTKRKSIKK